MKAELIAAVIASLRSEVTSLAAATGLAREAATDEQARPENKYDTRALEASYLAAGQGARLQELRQLLAWFEVLDPAQRYKTAQVGALVVVQDDKAQAMRVLLAPSGGLSIAGVRVISPASAWGRALAGLAEGDVTELRAPTGLRELELMEIY